ARSQSDTALDSHAAVPNSRPTTAVMPMASAPQKATRTDALSIGAPPVRAARAPSATRNTIDVVPTAGTTCGGGTASEARRGNAAPAAKLAADVRAAWTGLALTVSDIPSSSRE